MTAIAHPPLNPPVEDALSLAWRIVTVLPAARTLAELDPIELPEAEIQEDEVARLVTLGPLYLAAELETSRVVDAAETLAGVAMSGGLNIDLGAGADAIALYWRRRHERFSAVERRALFARMFDTAMPGPPLASRSPGGLAPFDSLMAAVVQELLEPSAQATQRLSIGGRHAAAALVDELRRRSSGVPAQLARELVGSLQQAIDLFKRPEIQRALGQRGAWAAVSEASRRWFGAEVPLAQHVARGRAGMVLLAWVASIARPAVGAGGVGPVPAEVLDACAEWAQATVALNDARSPR